MPHQTRPADLHAQPDFLGDLYRAEGLITRAQTCYEDVLKIAGDNDQRQSCLAAVTKK